MSGQTKRWSGGSHSASRSWFKLSYPGSVGAGAAVVLAEQDAFLAEHAGGIIAPQADPPALAEAPVILPQGAAIETPGSIAVMPGTSSEVTTPISQPLQVATSTSSSAADTSLSASTLPSYTVIDQETALGGAIYPFLEQTGRAWRVVESNVKEGASYPNPHTFSMDRPTLRYVNGQKIEDIFVDGMTTEQFQAATG